MDTAVVVPTGDSQRDGRLTPPALRREHERADQRRTGQAYEYRLRIMRGLTRLCVRRDGPEQVKARRRPKGRCGLWCVICNSRGGTRTRDPGIMSAVL